VTIPSPVFGPDTQNTIEPEAIKKEMNALDSGGGLLYPMNVTKGQWFSPVLLGFLAITFQIVLLREFSAFFYGNEITFGIVLGAWLLWGGLGSILGEKVAFSPEKLSLMFQSVLFLFPLCLLGLRFSRFWLNVLPGEMTGLFSILVSAMVLTLLVSFPLGLLFVLNVKHLEGDLAQTYFLESVGASLGGVVTYFVFIPTLSNWQMTSIMCVLGLIVVFFLLKKGAGIIFLLFLSAFFVAFFVFDLPSQKIFWKPFTLIESKDSRYGKLQAIQTEEQVSLYNNNVSMFSFPDLAASEESVHFAMSQYPEAQRILLIGGGVGGGLEQALKYPKSSIDYVELDPEIIRFSLEHLPRSERKAFQDPRIQVHYRDGRAYLTHSGQKYDVIILNLPEPTTAQINRFYTREFFLIVKNRLSEKGLFSFRIPSAENYISSELQDFLSSLFYTVKDVFPHVEIVPGNTNIFLASGRPLSLEYAEITHIVENLEQENTYVIPQLLIDRLSPLRIDLLRETVSNGKGKINRDLAPIIYFYNSVLWSTQFGSREARLFSALSRSSPFWFLDFPLILCVLILIVLGLQKQKTYFYLAPLAVLGFTTIVTEILLIFSFQTFYGYLYQRIALLFAVFMIGLSAGSFYGKKRETVRFDRILPVQSGFIVLLFVCLLLVKLPPPEIVFFAILFCLGFLGGDLFILSNRLYIKEKQNYGMGYGLDLVGSFIGAVIVSSVIFPLVGLLPLLKYLILLNSFCLLFLFWGLKTKDF
jgi:spermidine synthase